MRQVSMHEAKTHLSRLIRESLEGDEIIIAHGETPLVKLVPIAKKAAVRKIGNCKDLILHIDDDFDAPLDEFDEYMPP